MGIVSAVLRFVRVLVAMAVEHVVAPLLMPLVMRNLLPTFLIRMGVRAGLRTRLADIDRGDVDKNMAAKMAFIEELRTMPIAMSTAEANKQHYEVPADFYSLVMGPYKKYSCGYWPRPGTTFEESEVEALRLVCSRAQLCDRQRILDMGCGWGSLVLFMAARYPHAQITGVSNSNSQRQYIEAKCKEQGLTNVTIVTADVNNFHPDEDGKFDRVVSVEMIEHTKNVEALFGRVSRWLRPDGKLFVHIFVHKNQPYHFDKGWMAENFFTNGTMPSNDMLLYFQRDLRIANHWIVNGKHYQRTSEAWLSELDRHRRRVWPVLTRVYGAGNETRWYMNWRLFFIACAELFGFNDGKEWFVAHYLFENNRGATYSAVAAGAGAGAAARRSTRSP